MKKMLIPILLLSVLISACGNKNVSSVNHKEVESIYATMVNEAQKKISSQDLEALDKVTADMDRAEGDAKKLYALMLATDISIAQTGAVSKGMLAYFAGKALKAYPEHPLVLNNTASVLFDIGKTDEAIALYEQAIAIAPESPIVLINLANAYIEKDDFATAENYARKSLSIDEEYTAAYQVLTTCYLHKGQDSIAAETLIKSAKNCFNDLSVAQFESFLSEVGSLEGTDVYPLKEELLDSLYDVAKQNGEAVHDSADTPEGQIKLQPFPHINSIAEFIASIQRLESQEKAIFSMMQEAEEKLGDEETIKGRNKYIDGKEKTGNGLYPVRASLRQVYAYEVLTSFYAHQFKREYAKYKDAAGYLYDHYRDQLEAHDKKLEVNSEEMSRLGKAMESAAKAESFEEVSAYAAEMMRIVQNNSQYMELRFSLSTKYFNDYYSTLTDYYNHIKQISEEYWLRSGGLLKYVDDESAFKYLSAKRELLIYQNIYTAVCSLQMSATVFQVENELAKLYKEMWAIGEGDPSEASGAEIYMKPDVELPEPPRFKELNDAEFSKDLWIVSAEYSNKNLSVQINTPVSTHLIKKNLYDGTTTTATAYGVSPAIGFSVKMLLGKEGYKELQQKAWQYGINLPDNPQEGKKGQYITRDRNNRVVDKGSYHVMAAGFNVGGVGLEASKETMKSSVTGITAVIKSKSIGFSNLKLAE